ncbi:HNH endonuclease [Paenibacillus ehimensis]|uniref:HNH endonuclease n=1 Tax=Paenibacillus ehimensis TaxID=79264 RepID=UPI00046FDACA|nr:HNH endonuclease [Paenibacillus ehimensis]
MPAKPKKPCAFPTCPNLTKDRYCESHQDRAKQERQYYDRYVRDKKLVAFYHSVEWQRVRKQALMRDHGLCQQCLKEKQIVTADMVHHLREVKEAWHLRLTLSNLVSLCNACHNREHGQRGK